MMSFSNTTTRRKALTVFVHILFWVFLLITPLQLNLTFFEPHIAIIRISVPLFIALCLFYGNLKIVTPWLFQQGQFIWYRPIIIYPVFVLTGVFIEYNTFSFLNEWSGTHAVFEISVYTNDGRTLAHSEDPERILSTFISMAVLVLLFVSTVYGIVLEITKRDKKSRELEQENIKNELKFLRAQINPHFLFNALNNLYATLQLRPHEAGDFVLKLSEMLRYITYDCQKEEVSLQKEITYLEHYIFFQKKRDKRLKEVQFFVEQEHPALKIAPMLLIPFIENCFKHSYSDTAEDYQRFINVKLQTTSNSIYFEAANSIPPEGIGDTSSNQDEYAGVGIENVKRRLEIQYANQHTLQFSKQNQTYKIQLTIDL